MKVWEKCNQTDFISQGPTLTRYGPVHLVMESRFSLVCFDVVVVYDSTGLMFVLQSSIFVLRRRIEIEGYVDGIQKETLAQR